MREFGEIAERLRRSTVQVFSQGHDGGGSGIIWSSAGQIVTNSHVARASQADVVLWDGRRLPARLVSRDARRDLAELRIESSVSESGLPAATAGDSDALRPGELAIAIGSPLGFAGALSTGVIHSVGPIAGMGRERWIGASVRLAPGNSGGPLADARGRVIGINTAIFNGLGVAVPSNAAVDFLRRGARPSLGVTLAPVPHGMQIVSLDPHGAAAAASLRAGDILVGTFERLTEMLDSGRDTLRLPFFRGDTTRLREVFVRVAQRRAEAA
jgi:serine protease Do